MKRLWVLVACLLLAPSVSSQMNPIPGVTLECESGPHDIEVHPGSDRTVNVECVVVNDSIYTESVGISVTAAGLATAAPGSITLPPGGEEEFIVTLRGDEKMSPSTRNVTVTANVNNINGAPCVTCEPETVEFNVRILQYADLSVTARTGTLQMEIGTTSEVTFDLHNEGNGKDSFSVSIENKSALESIGFSFSVNDTGDLDSDERLPFSFTVSASSDIPETDVQVMVKFVSDFDNSEIQSSHFILRSDGAPESLIEIGSDETALLYGAISVAGLLIVILVIFIALRSVRRRRVVAFDDEFDDFVDFDDF
ncbi:MAG: choice-of-anchor T family protein [Candidatus Thalassarchaeaceae archaeon]|nr:choice-of-anchor T family protein [Candidatus Thalassarchaeaceae archaeon]